MNVIITVSKKTIKGKTYFSIHLNRFIIEHLGIDENTKILIGRLEEKDGKKVVILEKP